MQRMFRNINPTMMVYFLVLAAGSIALGFSDSVFGNYFKDAYNADAAMRGFIELPRELPGMLCMFLMAVLSAFGDLRLAILSQILCFAGIFIMGLFTPSFGVMLIFLFINSMGMHLYAPLTDSIGLSILDDSESVGRRMGQYNGIRTAFTMVASIVVFFGFRYGLFSFKADIKIVFILSACFFLVTVVLLTVLQKRVGKTEIRRKKIRFIFRKEYTLYYILAVTFGARKQIMFVYAPWVLIELMSQGADTMALLGIVASFIGIFFMPRVGKWIDRFGVRKVLFIEAAAFILLYLAYGFISGGMKSGTLPVTGIAATLVFVVYMLDKMTMQLGMVRVIYLRKIAVDKNDITPTLSSALSLDHVVSIICAWLGGIAWTTFGPQWVFYIAAALTVINLIVAYMVKVEGVKTPSEVSG